MILVFFFIFASFSLPFCLVASVASLCAFRAVSTNSTWNGRITFPKNRSLYGLCFSVSFALLLACNMIFIEICAYGFSVLFAHILLFDFVFRDCIGAAWSFISYWTSWKNKSDQTTEGKNKPFISPLPEHQSILTENTYHQLIVSALEGGSEIAAVEITAEHAQQTILKTMKIKQIKTNSNQKQTVSDRDGGKERDTTQNEMENHLLQTSAVLLTNANNGPTNNSEWKQKKNGWCIPKALLKWNADKWNCCARSNIRSVSQ